MQLKFSMLTNLFLFSLCLQAQPPAYPRHYFRSPVSIPMELSANFGELRSNHWHMGLDIRTNQRENLPVYAAAEGYIAHIGIRPQSFGRFIVINHPNGLSTLYAHLNDFFPELEHFVTLLQYKQESWAIELDFTRTQFPVTKGAFIAYSGNTGGSQGPHLHFEIFDTKTTKRLNPLLFGFPLRDNVPPALVKLAMYDRNKSTYHQSPEFYTLKNTDSGYVIPQVPVLKTGLKKISFALQAYDRLSGSTNPNGIYSAKLFLDDEPVIKFVLDSIDYEETVYMNAHIDYRHKSIGGSYLQHLSQLPGDKGAAYHPLKGDGVLNLGDTTLHQVSIEVKDANNNLSVLNFTIQYDDSLAKEQATAGSPQFIPNQETILEKPEFEMYMPESCMYDTTTVYYFRNNTVTGYALSAAHQVNEATVPLHDDITVRIKPDRNIPDEWKDKILIIRNSRGSSVRKAEWQGEWLNAKFSDLGTFQAFADILPPSINELGKDDTTNLSAAQKIVFTPTDNFGIRKFRAELDNQWIRFTNDKSRNWVYTFDERCPYGVHHLKVITEDVAGNITEKEWWFKRYPYTPPPKKKSVKKTTGKKKSSSAKKPVSKKKK